MTRHYRSEEGITGYEEGDLLVDDTTGERSLVVRDGRGVCLQPLYGVAEIAAALGVARTNICAWVSRGTHGMPQPDQRLASGPVWYGSTIEPWIRERLTP
jgi:hypothetical protein